MRILMSGGSGLIGTALSRRLEADGHTVARLVRRDAKAGEFTWDPIAGTLDPAAFDGCDAVVNLSGAGIGDKRWTDRIQSRAVVEPSAGDRVAGRDDGDRSITSRRSSSSGSAIGWYGDRGDERLDELSAPR